ncbi:MAG: hypothetical protein QF368_07010, partial [SAR202 cluster bacterium]|nr:hypothetical protein [SAR202 cluster bacterium]
ARTGNANPNSVPRHPDAHAFSDSGLHIDTYAESDIYTYTSNINNTYAHTDAVSCNPYTHTVADRQRLINTNARADIYTHAIDINNAHVHATAHHLHTDANTTADRCAVFHADTTTANFYRYAARSEDNGHAYTTASNPDFHAGPRSYAVSHTYTGTASARHGKLGIVLDRRIVGGCGTLEIAELERQPRGFALGHAYSAM